MQKITPFLWFNDNAEQAVKLYTSLFRRSKILKTTRFSDAAARASGRPKGSIMTIAFTLEGQKFTALNGGPYFKFTEAVSFVVNCRTQSEIDRYWKKLSAGGEPGQCGWLKDKFGLSWQIVPAILPDLLSSNHHARTERVMEALLKINKLEIKKLKATATGKQ